jgi:hypothetical protein
MSHPRQKKMLLSVAVASLGVVAPIACASRGVVGDIAVPPDDASDARFFGKLPIDAGPDSSYPDVVVGAMPLDSGND